MHITLCSFSRNSPLKYIQETTRSWDSVSTLGATHWFFFVKLREHWISELRKTEQTPSRLPKLPIILAIPFILLGLTLDSSWSCKYWSLALIRSWAPQKDEQIRLPTILLSSLFNPANFSRRMTSLTQTKRKKCHHESACESPKHHLEAPWLYRSRQRRYKSFMTFSSRNSCDTKTSVMENI